MANKKYSNFEYASLTDKGGSDAGSMHRYDAFETPYGYAFVIVSNDQADKHQMELCSIAIERIRYYLENEPGEDMEVVHRNAITYAGGYLYQMGQKVPMHLAGKISCMCVLFSNEKIYYSWAGNVDLFLFVGKRMYLLSWKNADNEKTTDTGGLDETTLEGKNAFLGKQAVMVPNSGIGCVEPVNGDILIMASGTVCRRLHTKDIKKVLQDSMPLQTKAARIMHHSGDAKDNCPATLVLLRFHDLGNTERSFGAGQVVTKADSSMQKTGQVMATKKQTRKMPEKNSLQLLKTILSVIGLIIVGYFAYDLFRNPRPPVSDSQKTEATVDDTSAYALDEELNGEPLAPEIAVPPNDVTYIVRSGDTWPRLYSLYGVCSWFIINHAPNSGRFGRDNILIAGESLRIPVKYSSKVEYNPHYYHEFTTDKVGRGCENAGRDFIRAFEAKIAE